MPEMSPKKRAENTARRKFLRELMDDRGPLCEAQIEDVCSGSVDTGHEKLRRSQGGSPVDPKNVVLICVGCHDWVHNNVAKAIELGLLIKSWDAVDPEGSNDD